MERVVPATGSEFKQASVDDLKWLAAKNDSMNTQLFTSLWDKRYEKWATEHGKEPNLAVILPSEFDEVLQQFYTELLEQSGYEYEPELLKMSSHELN